MTELLPCPFCGGEAYTVNDGGRYWTVECHDCAAHTGLYATKDFAIVAWNSRAERTCKNTSDSNYFRCSVCRKKTYRGDETFNYCPNCGCKVLRNTPKCSEITTKVVGE